MSNLFVCKEQLQRFYAKNSRYIDKALQFILGLVTFALINSNIGFMKPAAQPLVTLALGIIAAFIPLTLLVVIASVVVLLHMYALSLGAVIVMAAVFLIMYIFYFQFTSKCAIVVLLTPIAFMLKIPFVIPIIFGLIGTPIYAIPIICGTITYFMMEFARTNVTVITGAKGLVGQLTIFAQQALQNKSMWITIAAFVICLLLVYTIRRQAFDNAWKAAIASGAVANVLIMIVGDVALNVHTSYVVLIVGSIVSILIAIVLEFFVFSVDYSRSERLQFEDDEYYYYVKAVPKISVTAPEKTVKRINERQETVAIDIDEVPTSQTNLSHTDELLLAKSLKEELDIQKIIEKELEK